jgi:hypothetical protein
VRASDTLERDLSGVPGTVPLETMDGATCPGCGYHVGLGIASEPGTCPECRLPLMLACELRALTPAQLQAEVARRLRPPAGPDPAPANRS